jgi:putative ABC transport system permease protein
MTWFYRLLLRAYPRDLRVEHGDEMAAAFSERWRVEARGVWPRLRLTSLLLADFCASLLREWRAALGAPRTTGVHRGAPWPMTDLLTDLRLAFRQLAMAPIFALGATLTLGLGVGATTAIFSLAGATLLRPVPIADADRILQSQWSWSLPDFRDLESDNEVFSHVAAWSGLDFGFGRDGATVALPGLAVSGRYFALTGLKPEAGRLLVEEDDEAGAAAGKRGHRVRAMATRLRREPERHRPDHPAQRETGDGRRRRPGGFPRFLSQGVA